MIKYLVNAAVAGASAAYKTNPQWTQDVPKLVIPGVLAFAGVNLAANQLAKRLPAARVPAVALGVASSAIFALATWTELGKRHRGPLLVGAGLALLGALGSSAPALAPLLRFRAPAAPRPAAPRPTLASVPMPPAPSVEMPDDEDQALGITALVE